MHHRKLKSPATISMAAHLGFRPNAPGAGSARETQDQQFEWVVEGAAFGDEMASGTTAPMKFALGFVLGSIANLSWL